LEAKDGNSKTDQDSNTQADDDRFSIVVARDIEPKGEILIRNKPIKDFTFMHKDFTLINLMTYKQ